MEEPIRPISKYKPEEPIIKKKFLLGIIITVGIGAINFGYSITVFNPMIIDFLKVFEVPKTEKDYKFWTTVLLSTCSLGAFAGSLIVGPFLKFGKKTCIHVNNIILTLGCLLSLIQNIYVVTVGRFLCGFSAGAFSVLVPSYINEVSPTELKGQYVSLTQVFITLGAFMTGILGIPLPTYLDTNLEDNFIDKKYWRLLFSLPILFAGIQTALILSIKNFESPKFLKQNQMMNELNQLMRKIYPPNEVICRMDAILVNESAEDEPTYYDILCSPKYRIATYIGLSLGIIQQVTGINIVIFYSSYILDATGITPNQITAIIGSVNFISVFPSLMLHQKFGRKTLLVIFTFGIAAWVICLGIFLCLNGQWSKNNFGQDNQLYQTFSILFLVLYLIFFQLSLGSIYWIYISEILTEKGLSLTQGVNWFISSLIAFSTQTLISEFGGNNLGRDDLGSGRLFLLCGVITLISALFMIYFVKETKGLTEQEVANLYSQDPNVIFERYSLLEVAVQR